MEVVRRREEEKTDEMRRTYPLALEDLDLVLSTRAVHHVGVLALERRDDRALEHVEKAPAPFAQGACAG